MTAILNFQDVSGPVHASMPSNHDPQDGEGGAPSEADSLSKKKIESGRKLIAELKKLFGSLACGNKKYVDPSGVLRSIVDDFG